MSKMRGMDRQPPPQASKRAQSPPQGASDGYQRCQDAQTPAHPFVMGYRGAHIILMVMGWTLWFFSVAHLILGIYVEEVHHPIVTWVAIDWIGLGLGWVWLCRQIVRFLHELGHAAVAGCFPHTSIRMTFVTESHPMVTVYSLGRITWIFRRQTHRQWGRVQGGWRHWDVRRRGLFLLAGNGIVMVVVCLLVSLVEGMTMRPMVYWGCWLFVLAATLNVTNNTWPWPVRRGKRNRLSNGYRWRLRQDGTRLWYLRFRHVLIHAVQHADTGDHAAGECTRRDPRADDGGRDAGQNQERVADPATDADPRSRSRFLPVWTAWKDRGRGDVGDDEGPA